MQKKIIYILKMKKIAPPLLAIALLFLFSCSSEKVKISENYITEFKIDGISPIEIDIGNDLIYVRTIPENKTSLLGKTPEITVSKEATLSDNGLNWTAEGFKYTVTAENGDARDYSVVIDVSFPKKYSFETWKLSTGQYVYYAPSDSNLGWSSGNAGIAMALSMIEGKDSKNPEHYPTKKTTEGHSGNAVLMETIKGGYISIMSKNIPLISGNFFLGNFNLSKLISDELAATEVGRIYPAKPKTIKGYYKYTEGPGDYYEFDKDSNYVPVPGKKDSCNMSIRFYQSDLPSGRDTTLTVKPDEIDESDLIRGRITKADCSDTGGKFERFELELEYAGEPVDIANHRYKLAITFAASRNGGDYAGKIGSKFIVDEIEIEDY
jgi:hypothetical protein